ncbi:F-box/kelch-repeat protein At3g06240-like [Mercurialis annua]|uniref:F-box/kelch-repeat protein At3g06240-like n=1 Tax=Mercurialis annua TaxID=3986 RepID=UPI00215FB6FE|nr:F-box/kelch-repeat protein At3g06240-like [Mercurialis annua]
MPIHDLVRGRKTGVPTPTSTFVNYGSIKRLMQEKNRQVIEIDSSCSHELLFDMLPSNWDPHQITCCCDGIMCITLCNRLLLLNPNTDDCKMLPFPDPDDIFPAHKWEAFGFGYVSSTDDYKIVNVPSYRLDLQSKNHNVYIMTLKSNLWRKIGIDFPYLVTECGRAISIDLDKEICTQLPMPPNVVVLPHSVNLSSLGVLASGISAGNHDASNNCFDIWIFKGETWIKHLNFPASIHKGPDDCYVSNVIPTLFRPPWRAGDACYISHCLYITYYINDREALAPIIDPTIKLLNLLKKEAVYC